MQTVPLDASWFEGAVSVPTVDEGLMPYRLPWAERRLWHLAIADSIAWHTSGVRIRCATDADELVLDFAPMPPCYPGAPHAFDLTNGGELVASLPAPEGATAVRFALSSGMQTIEIWLPQGAPTVLRALQVNDGAVCRPASDPRPRWITYGSSITHCVRAHSPARTWPAIVARCRGLHLTNLGYGGQCHLEAQMGLLIRDLPADVITLKLGINTIGGSMAQRVFLPAVIGLVRLIREKHPNTPIALVSPIAYPPNETTPNAVGVTMRAMRADVEDAYHRLVDAGDVNLYYIDGLEIFGEELLAQYSDDQCHPDADGIEVMADRFDRLVMDILPFPVCTVGPG